MNQPAHAQAEDVLVLDDINTLLTDLVKSLVAMPDAVSVTYHVHGDEVTFGIKPQQADVRFVNGKGGKHIKAINVIVAAMLEPSGRRADVRLLEDNPHGIRSAITSPFSAFDPKKLDRARQLLEELIWVFVEKDDALRVTVKKIFDKAFMEIFVAPEDYPNVYGKPMKFELEPGNFVDDGHLIGSIKSIFDGVGKRCGCKFQIDLHQTPAV